MDLSVGTPTDPPPDVALAALRSSEAERAYPPSIGTSAFRDAASGWLYHRFGVDVPPSQLAACIGTKELVAGIPHWLALRDPTRDTVLYPAVSYPTYAMGAELARCRAVPVPVDDRWRLDLGAVGQEDVERALCLWVNTPGNPAGGLDDLEAAAAWGRRHDVPVLSDECYTEFTWETSPRTVLRGGTEGVLAVHSLSKRSNLAGTRVGFYAGDADLVAYLRELRKHAGFMVPGPVQAAGAAALCDQEHVEEQRERYRRRLERGIDLLAALGCQVGMPGGGFYLWVPAPEGDAWAFARYLAERGGAVVSPGEFYGSAGAGYVRAAMVRPVEALDLVARRLGV